MDHLPAFIMFAAIAAITPGPNNIMIMASGVNFGLRASMPHLLGICFGAPLMMAAAGFGIGTLFEVYPWLHTLIKIVGLAYLIYLAYRIALSAPADQQRNPAKPLTFIEAALFQWVNPKTWLMGTSAIATYTTVGLGMAPQVAIVVLVFFLMTWPSAGGWLLFGTALQRLFANPAYRRIFNYSMAVLLLLSVSGVIKDLFVHFNSLLLSV